MFIQDGAIMMPKPTDEKVQAKVPVSVKKMDVMSENGVQAYCGGFTPAGCSNYCSSIGYGAYYCDNDNCVCY